MLALLRTEWTYINTSIKSAHVDIMHKKPFEVRKRWGKSYVLVTPMDGYFWSFWEHWLLFYPEGQVVVNGEE